MSKKGDYRSFYALVIILITTLIGIIKATFTFLQKVNQLKLWGNLGISLLIMFFINSIAFIIAEKSLIDVFVWTAIISFIGFCIYWHIVFASKDIRRNAQFWQDWQFWWSLDGWQFEQEVARVFRAQGYKAKVTKGSGDDGVDIILNKDGYISIVQCKHYRNPVPPEPIRALWGCKGDFGASEVILVASSGITESGKKFISNKPNFKVLTLEDIIRMTYDAENVNINTAKTTVGRKIDV